MLGGRWAAGGPPIWKEPLSCRGSFPFSSSASRLQGSKGGASWKGGYLGCDESSQTEGTGTSLVSESAWLQTQSSELMKKQALLLKGAFPRAGCWHRRAPLPVGISRQCPALPGRPGFLPTPQGCATVPGSLGAGLGSSLSPSWIWCCGLATGAEKCSQGTG